MNRNNKRKANKTEILKIKTWHGSKYRTFVTKLQLNNGHNTSPSANKKLGDVVCRIYAYVHNKYPNDIVTRTEISRVRDEEMVSCVEFCANDTDCFEFFETPNTDIHLYNIDNKNQTDASEPDIVISDDPITETNEEETTEETTDNIYDPVLEQSMKIYKKIHKALITEKAKDKLEERLSKMDADQAARIRNQLENSHYAALADKFIENRTEIRSDCSTWCKIINEYIENVITRRAPVTKKDLANRYDELIGIADNDTGDGEIIIFSVREKNYAFNTATGKYNHIKNIVIDETSHIEYDVVEENVTPELLEKYIFFYSNDGDHAYKSGWTEVYARNQHAAVQIFKIMHTNASDGKLGCSGYFSADISPSKLSNLKGKCHEILRLNIG